MQDHLSDHLSSNGLSALERDDASASMAAGEMPLAQLDETGDHLGTEDGIAAQQGCCSNFIPQPDPSCDTPVTVRGTCVKDITIQLLKTHHRPLAIVIHVSTIDLKHGQSETLKQDYLPCGQSTGHRKAIPLVQPWRTS